VKNDVSSTKIREFLQARDSIRYLVPEPVGVSFASSHVTSTYVTQIIEYIAENHLYSDGQTPISTPAQPNAKVSTAD